MYSGTTLTKQSGRIMGAHQKIDRIARLNLSKLLVDNTLFPTTKKILHFEGNNGPDGIKRKSPAQNEPWHYFNPFNETDRTVLDQINDHYSLLVKELKADNKERIAFEAAWLAHAMVDGLTPAHHFPYGEKVSELRGGKSNESRTTYKEKLVMHGDTKREKVKNNWKMWGPKGLMMSHGTFEIGIATIIAPLAFSDSKPTFNEISSAHKSGLEQFYLQKAREVAVLDLFNKYIEKGWTPNLTLKIRNKLIPEIIKTVTIFWYCALIDAEIIQDL